MYIHSKIFGALQGGDETCWDWRRPRVAVFNERDAGNAFTWRKNQLSDFFLLGDSSATNPGCQWRWCWGRRSRTTECCWQCWSELPSRVPWIDFRTYLKLSNTHSTYVWMTFFCSIALCCRVGTQLSFYLRWDGKETWRACQGLMTLSTWKREEAGKAFRVIYIKNIVMVYSTMYPQKEEAIFFWFVMPFHVQARDPPTLQEVPDGQVITVVLMDSTCYAEINCQRKTLYVKGVF